MKDTSSFETRHPEYSTTIKETEFAIRNLLRRNLQSQRAALAPLPDFRHLYERSRKAEEAARSPPHGAPRRAGQWTQGLYRILGTSMNALGKRRKRHAPHPTGRPGGRASGRRASHPCLWRGPHWPPPGSPAWLPPPCPSAPSSAA